MKRVVFALAAMAGLLVLTPFAQAAIIAPGGSTSSTTGASGDLGANTLLASATLPVATPTFTATVREAVVRENANSLTFLYQYVNSPNSLDTLRRGTGSRYDGNTTDVFVATTNLPALFTAGTVTYNTADRSNESGTTGNVVGFNLPTSGTGALAPGQTSRVYAVRVNASTFDALGFASLIDETSGFIAGFEPTNIVPEPALGAMLAMGLVAAVARRTRR